MTGFRQQSSDLCRRSAVLTDPDCLHDFRFQLRKHRPFAPESFRTYRLTAFPTKHPVRTKIPQTNCRHPPMPKHPDPVSRRNPKKHHHPAPQLQTSFRCLILCFLIVSCFHRHCSRQAAEQIILRLLCIFSCSLLSITEIRSGHLRVKIQRTADIFKIVAVLIIGVSYDIVAIGHRAVGHGAVSE